MKQTDTGIFSRGKFPFLEIGGKRSDGYTQFAKTAALKCKLSRPDVQSIPALFKMNGARILNESMTIAGKVKPWTLGNFLLLMKKSASSVKIGVCYIASSLTSSESSGDEVFKDHN